jgi:outer membrane protein assembly factor BamB
MLVLSVLVAIASAMLVANPALAQVSPSSAATNHAGAPSSPQVWDLPTQGPPTTNVLVQGAGFDPLTAIDVYFDSTKLISTTTDKNGAFGNGVVTATGATFTRLQVPANAVPGQHTITAQERVGQKSAQKSFLVQTDWPQFGFNEQHTGFNPYENVLNPSTVDNLMLRWVYPSLYPFSTSPVVANGTVYAGINNGEAKIVALDANTGALVWQYQTLGEFSVGEQLAAVNGIVYFPQCDLQYVCALNASTGGLMWEFYIGGYGVYSAPAVANGVVYVGVGSGMVYALDAGTGALLWKSKAGVSVATSPAVADGMVYVGSDVLYAFDAGTGALIWTYTNGDKYVGTPAVADGRVYVASCCAYNTSNFYAVNAKTGTLIWTFPAWLDDSGVPAVANGVVYVATADGTVHALEADTGALLWEYATGFNNSHSTSPSVANGVVYSAWENGTIYALDAGTGILLWKDTLPPPNGFSSTPAVVNGMVYAGTDTNASSGLYAFGLPNQQGSEKSSPSERLDPARLTSGGRLQPTKP